MTLFFVAIVIQKMSGEPVPKGLNEVIACPRMNRKWLPNN